MSSGGGSSGDVPKPFEWLSGGLFFGKSNKGGIESVDKEKDVNTLLKDIQTNLDETLEQQEVAAQQQLPSASAEGASSSSIPPDSKIGDRDNVNNDAAATASTKDGEDDPDPSEFLAARLARLRFLLYDERRMTSQQESSHRRVSHPSVASTTVEALAGTTLEFLMPKLLDNLLLLPFESRKHVAAIFNYLLVCGFEGNDGEQYVPIMNAFRDYIEVHFEVILPPIMKGHETATARGSGGTDVALHCGSMYRSCFRHVSLYRQLVFSPPRVEQYILPFLDTYALLPNFDVSSDAMESLKLVMTAGTTDNSPANGNTDSNMSTGSVDEGRQQEMAELAAAFLTRDYEIVWDKRFNPNLLSDDANYMTKRVALQILSTVLLTRSNYAVMIRYVNSRSNLILVMKLLRDPSPHITLDAFHVFKVFVANPSKIPDVEKILRDNSTKLCAYLETLHQDKEQNDQQFADEKRLIIATIRGL
jgi:calcium binding protein 39